MISLETEEQSSDAISMSDLGLRQNSYYNVFPTYESLNHRGETPIPFVENAYDALSFGSDSIRTEVSSHAPVVDVNQSISPNLKKICIIAVVVLSVCIIIALSVAFGIVANRAYHKDDSSK